MTSLADQIAHHWATRTKPLHSLGRLEDIATRYCLIRNQLLPRCDRFGLFLCAASHGITAEGVSLYPPAVTAQMLANFRAGNAAINVLARLHNVTLHLEDCGVAHGTANFLHAPAMTPQQCDAQLTAGAEKATLASHLYDAVALGEMGIGNTTSAAALLAALGPFTGPEVAGRGAGLNPEQIAHKASVIDRALAFHQLTTTDPLRALTSVGGFEIARMVGFLLAAAERRLPVMLDGFITTAAALVATRLDPRVSEILFFSHLSAEKAHRLLLDLLDADPYLDLGLRLGEGSGAILGLHLLHTAMKLYSEMASFDSAHVSQANS